MQCVTLRTKPVLATLSLQILEDYTQEHEDYKLNDDFMSTSLEKLYRDKAWEAAVYDMTRYV